MNNTQKKVGMNRRVYLDKMCPAEVAIYNAILEVEKMPADTRLTEAVILLGKAKDSVADFIDGVKPKFNESEW